MQPTKPPRELAHDEKRAADQAFKGLPFDSRWSPSARAIYDGIRGALGVPALPEQEPAADPSEPHAVLDPQLEETESDEAASILTREQAIQAGFLIDVTPIAHSVGLPVPISISKPLWMLGITASDTIPEDQREARVRDVLMALRLRLANARVAPPGIEFAALLSFPPEPTPQLLSLYVIAHGDQTTPYTLTILLANEVTAIIRPTNN
ncbi:MAG: hypothetical protein Q7R68_03800 [Nitrospirales bacterium]|nr:hypothetical protein [Nitrospirales bacterium]